MKTELTIKAIQEYVKDKNGKAIKDLYVNSFGFDDVFTEEDTYMDYFKSDEYLKSHLTDKNIESITKKVSSNIEFDHYLLTHNLQIVANDFIRNLPNRINEDLEAHNYDSVITKSRTLIESVCKLILQEKASNDNTFSQLVTKCKESIGIQKERPNDKNSYEGLINQFEGGINTIVQAIGKLRNDYSDAHGSITRAIIEKRYAVLIANTSITIAEYLLETYENMKDSQSV